MAKENAACFKCEKPITSAIANVSPWFMPSGVLFEGGSTFGSSLYDTPIDGVSVIIIICDDCIKAAQGTDRLREIKDNKRKFNAK